MVRYLNTCTNTATASQLICSRMRWANQAMAISRTTSSRTNRTAFNRWVKRSIKAKERISLHSGIDMFQLYCVRRTWSARNLNFISTSISQSIRRLWEAQTRMPTRGIYVVNSMNSKTSWIPEVRIYRKQVNFYNITRYHTFKILSNTPLLELYVQRSGLLNSVISWRSF